ncbi:methyl transferase [Ilyonectria sp. MPI-CAGE-AT-0026]|nr:methyl transferase [Ilyonectria sp. MPI-CAGE-AT-0026]
MSSQSSISEPEGRYLEDGYWRHGRFYGSWKRGKYLFPIDSEELNRLDIFHKVFLVARENKPFRVPIVRQAPRLMDLGTGTDGQVMAVDLNQIQPALIPVGFVPQQFDIEEPEWDPLLTECDLIYMRMLLGSLQTDIWPQTYRKVFEHLAPGIGHMEHVEIDWTPRCDDDERPSKSAFKEWTDLFYDGMDQFNRCARVMPEETRQRIEAAGFTDLKEDVIKAYVCPWSKGGDERELARWFNLGLTDSLEPLSLMSLIEKQDMKFDDVRELCKKAKKEICDLRYHTYCNIHVWTARKPELQ